MLFILFPQIMRKLILILNGTRFVSARVLLQPVVVFVLAPLFRSIAPTLAQLTISARWWRLLLVGPTFLLSWHALLSTFALLDQICSDSSRLMAHLAVRLTRPALLHCFPDAAGRPLCSASCTFSSSAYFLFCCSLSSGSPSICPRKKKKNIENAF